VLCDTPPGAPGTASGALACVHRAVEGSATAAGQHKRVRDEGAGRTTTAIATSTIADARCAVQGGHVIVPLEHEKHRYINMFVWSFDWAPQHVKIAVRQACAARN
jgi:hypothetical protein